MLNRETTQDRQPTPKPRDRRALSALRHGLTGQIYILTQTDQVAYDLHCQGFHDSFLPATPVEAGLVQAVADDRWRLKRASALENSIFAEAISQPSEVTSGNPEVDAALVQGQVWLAEAKNLALLTLYESRIQRRVEKNMAELRTLQAERQAALQHAVDEAILLTQEAESKGETFDIERDFTPLAASLKFDFSTTEIASLASRQRRLAEAIKFSRTHVEPRKRAA
jgi:hypothetical protein